MARRDRASPAPAAGLRQGLRRGRRLHRRRRRRRYGSDQGRDRREHHHYAAAQEYRGLLGRRPCLQRPVLRRDAARRGALVRGHERPGCRDQGRGGRGGDQAPVHGLLFPCHVLRRRLRVLPKLRRLHICREHLLLVRGDIDHLIIIIIIIIIHHRYHRHHPPTRDPLPYTAPFPATDPLLTHGPDLRALNPLAPSTAW